MEIVNSLLDSAESNVVIDTQDKDRSIDQLMTLYSEKVYLLAFSFVKDRGLAEDISQEVFIKCYQNLEKCRGEAAIKSWIYRITVNTAKDFLRKKSFQIFKFPKLFFENIRSTGESSEDQFLKEDQNDTVLKMVLSLPDKYREVIILHYFHDLKVNEVSDVLKLSVNTVKTRLTRGRSLLKKNMNLIEGRDFLNG